MTDPELPQEGGDQPNISPIVRWSLGAVIAAMIGGVAAFQAAQWYTFVLAGLAIAAAVAMVGRAILEAGKSR